MVMSMACHLSLWLCYALSQVCYNCHLNCSHTWYLPDPELEKAMAPHSSTLAWKIPWMEEPGRLQSMGSLRVRHDWVTSLSLFTFMHWRRKWQPTWVFLPGESPWQRSLRDYSPWGCKESDTAEWLSTAQHLVLSLVFKGIFIGSL